MSRVVDLSDLVADLRSEQAGDERAVRFADRDWTLPALLPIAVTRYWDAYADPEPDSTRIGARLAVALEALFGDQLDAFYAVGLAPTECQTVINWIVSRAYGSAESPGNSGGSSEPSATPAASDGS